MRGPGDLPVGDVARSGDRPRSLAGKAAASGAPPHRTIYVHAFFALSITLVFGRSLAYGFVNFDDPHYVINNFSLHDGLTWTGLVWAFTTDYAENWHPLTWVSHMLDFEVWGMRPGAHRYTNILLHIASSSVLFAALFRMTGAYWRSAAVAALFALHPLHVESVVWVAERKDVLSGLFWMLALYAYAGYAKHPSFARYALVFALVALGLLAKSMVVTLPLVLLLLDYWPLKRITWESKFTQQTGRLLLEKAPLLALSLLFSAVTLFIQQAGGTMKAMESLPLDVRLINAVVAYGAYAWKTMYPLDLAVLYPHRGAAIETWKVALSGLFLAGCTVGALLAARRAPYVLVGWLWFAGTLVPVIGLVQVGDQAYADRYTYVPLIGLFLMTAWGANDALDRFAPRRRVVPVLGGLLILLLAGVSWRQVGYWRDSVSLFERCLAVTGPNPPAHNNLGTAYQRAGRPGEAETEFRRALELLPGYYAARNNLALLLLEEGRASEAAEMFRSLANEYPDDPRLFLNLGIAQALLGRDREAEANFRESAWLRPDFYPAYYNLGLVLERQGRPAEAARAFDKVLQITPGHEGAREGLTRTRPKKENGGDDVPAVP